MGQLLLFTCLNNILGLKDQNPNKTPIQSGLLFRNVESEHTVIHLTKLGLSFRNAFAYFKMHYEEKMFWRS